MNGIRIPNDWRWGRVREDVDAGRLWKARDRLQGCLLAEPANQDVLDMLGAVWFAMGQLPAAGRHWWLTERDDEKAATARAAFYERFGHRAHEVLRALPRPAKPEHYPVSVRGRLEELVTAKADGHGWHPSDWKPTPSEWESSEASRTSGPSASASRRSPSSAVSSACCSLGSRPSSPG